MNLYRGQCYLHSRQALNLDRRWSGNAFLLQRIEHRLRKLHLLKRSFHFDKGAYQSRLGFQDDDNDQSEMFPPNKSRVELFVSKFTTRDQNSW